MVCHVRKIPHNNLQDHKILASFKQKNVLNDYKIMLKTNSRCDIVIKNFKYLSLYVHVSMSIKNVLMTYLQNPQIYSFSPEYGSRSGGTILTIHGRNLEIGSSCKVHIMHLPCKLIG